MTEPTDVIRLYLDDDKEPFKTARPPLRFQFSTLHLADGPHRLRVEAHNGLAGDSVKEVPFAVRNGVAITVSGIAPQQEVAGQVGLIINAYAGNTEVDFEPSRAETPQPIPTWAWLIFLAIVAWTMFYVLNPAAKQGAAATTGVSDAVGERVYVDVCAKCHGEDGMGDERLGPARLQDSTMVLTPDPTDLVSWVCGGPVPDEAIGAGPVGSGRPRMRMLSFGPPRLRPLELVAALNYARSHWGNQAPAIEPTTQRPPAEIRALDEALVRALQGRDPDLARIEDAYAKGKGRTPRLVRRGLDRVDVDVSTAEAIRDAYKGWLASVREVNSVDLQQAAYAVLENGQVVYGHGKIVLTVTARDGSPARAYDGEFVRVYVREFRSQEDDGTPRCDPDGKPLMAWRLAFDYATTPMSIGCPPGREGEQCSEVEAARLGYADIQRILASLGQRATQAPHGNFWELPYREFVAREFAFPPIPGATIKMVNVDAARGIRGAESNLVKALRDGREVLVNVPGKGLVPMDIERMPKKSKPLGSAELGRIIAWLDRGYPEVAPGAPREPTAAMGGGETPPTDDPGMREPAAMTTDGGAGGGATVAGASAWGFDEVVAFFAALNPKAGSAPHKEFWKRSYEDFLKFEFDVFSEGAKARLVEPGKPARSNLLRALKREKLLLVKPDGSESEYDPGMPMPPKGKGAKPSVEDLAKLEAWIAAGCPKQAGAGGAPPPTPPAAPPSTPAPAAPPAAPSAPAMDTPPPPPSAPAMGAETAATPPAAGDALDFAGVVALFEAWKPKAGSAPHKEFWKLPYDKFVAFKFPIYAENGTAKLVEPGNPDRSNLLRALEKKLLLVQHEDGTETEYDPGKSMPPAGKGTKPKPEELAKLRAWIAAGCPERR